MIYLLVGEDNFLKDQFVKKYKKNFGELQSGINYIKITEDNIDNLIPDIETPAFGFENKLIIVNNANLFTKKNYTADNIAEYMKENEITNVDILFIEDKAEKNSLYNEIAKIGEIKQFNEQRIPELIKQIKSIANAYKVNINENTAQYLIECVGTNMQDIINELRKLIEYAGENGEIKREVIDNLTIKKTESIIFELTDSLGKRQIKKAIEVLHNLQYEKEPTQMILIMLYRHFKKLYIVHLCNGLNLIENLNLKPNQTFLVRKYQEQAKCFKSNEIEQILNELIDLDENSKNGNIDLDLGLETILCRYCS